ncbi:conserved hypothetical protein [Parafrankia sp. Ea1.12]|nr:conserved hypothetical protein [Parafrankia sp. Ea1.12]
MKLRAEVGGLVGTDGNDAVTEAGDEAVVDAGPHARVAHATADAHADANAGPGPGPDDDGTDPPTEIVSGLREVHAAGDDEPADSGSAEG